MLKKIAFFIIVVGPAASAYANPSPGPMTFVANGIVISASLWIEIFVTTGVLVFCSLAFRPLFVALIFGNAISFFGVLLPLKQIISSIFYIEIVVVIVEAVYIKLICFGDVFQADNFTGLKWRYALLASLIGNSCSYLCGEIMVP